VTCVWQADGVQRLLMDAKEFRSEDAPFLQLLTKTSPYTDEELEQLRSLSFDAGPEITDNWMRAAQLKLFVELTLAVRKLDRASSSLVNTTNKLTIRILWLTIVAVFVGVVQLAVAIISLLSTK
jgi:hypothetical protein